MDEVVDMAKLVADADKRIPVSTDLPVFLDMLKRSGIKYEESETPDGREIVVKGGYVCFYTQILFDRTGALRSIKAYE